MSFSVFDDRPPSALERLVNADGPGGTEARAEIATFVRVHTHQSYYQGFVDALGWAISNPDQFALLLKAVMAQAEGRAPSAEHGWDMACELGNAAAEVFEKMAACDPQVWEGHPATATAISALRLQEVE